MGYYGPEAVDFVVFVHRCCPFSVIISRHYVVFRLLQVSLYLDKFSGVCQTVLHDCKLTFLQIICDQDLFVEMPGRDPSDR
jgi:hypothetical protein